MVFFFQFEEAVTIFQRRDWVVDTAGTDDDEKAAKRVSALNSSDAIISTGQDGLFGICGLRNFVLEEVGRR
jgi:hypothetical protein